MSDQFNGLMAVVEVLCKFEGYDSSEYKKLFEFDSELKQIKQLV
jgi:hypothetical protein